MFHHEINTVFTAFISRLLWSISVILWEFLGARIGSGILAKRPPQVRNDDGNENEELRVALRYVWWRQEWQDLLVGYKGIGVGCEIQDQSDIKLGGGWHLWDSGDGRMRSGWGQRRQFGTYWISGDYDTFSCQMEKLKRQLSIFLVEPIK